MKKIALVLFFAVLIFALCACGGDSAEPQTEAPAQEPARTEAAQAVYDMIDAIPRMAEDRGNADEVYDAYTAAQEAYFKLSYEEMNTVNNVGWLWRASDEYFLNVMGGGDEYDYVALQTAAGELLQGTWYNSGAVCWRSGEYVINSDGSVITPYSTEPQMLTAFTDNTYYIPEFGTVYPDYSMGTLRLASEEGAGCLIKEETLKEMFVCVEVSQENIAQLVRLESVETYTDEWGDTACYSDNGESVFSVLDANEDPELTFIGCSDLQIEIIFSDGSRQTAYGMGPNFFNGAGLKVKELGRAKGTMWYAKSIYVDRGGYEDGVVSVQLNDGALYSWYMG